jgi:D-alanyl-D-alanine carboxypeptidase (penicillin-binding protein 5/6)
LAGSIEEEEYLKLSSILPEWVWEDIEEDVQYWRQYKGKVSDIYYSANDAFLKVNHQEDGMRSYGRMLDLVLAYYRENGELGKYSAAPEPVLAEVVFSEETLYSPHVVLADRETGIILFSKNSGAMAEPASVTKILTAVTAIEMIGDLDGKVTMTTRDFADLYRRGASLSGFEVGEEVSYRELLYTLMLVSGCDSAYALANNLCGGLPAFADKMNEKVADLGLTGSHFVDPSGLTAEYHYSTAEDTIAILDYALKNPVFRQIFETRSYQVSPTNRKPDGMEINNAFFSRLDRTFEGGYLENGACLLGGKTGFTNAAGLCLATVGTFEGREYIAVIFGGPGDNRTPQYNFMDALYLYGSMVKPVFAANTP